MKLFSRQLVTKQKAITDCGPNRELEGFPSLIQWLQVVGLSDQVIKVSCPFKFRNKKKESEMEDIRDYLC